MRRQDHLLIYQLMRMSLVLFVGFKNAKNYSSCTAHFLDQLYKVPHRTAVVLLKSLTVNTKGPGRGVATDMFLEHLIKIAKEGGSDGQSLASMQQMTLGVDLTSQSRTQMTTGLGISNSSTHIKPDSRDDQNAAAIDLVKKPTSVPRDWVNPFLQAKMTKLTIQFGEFSEEGPEKSTGGEGEEEGFMSFE